MIEQRPQRLRQRSNRIAAAQRRAVAAARQIGNDDAELSFQDACLQLPIGAAGAQPVDQHQILAVPADTVVQRCAAMFESSHRPLAVLAALPGNFEVCSCQPWQKHSAAVEVTATGVRLRASSTL